MQLAPWPAGLDAALLDARRHLARQFSAAWSEGQGLDLPAAVALALDRPALSRRDDQPPTRPLLSRRQLQVASLVAEGLTNVQIGRRLRVTERTRTPRARLRRNPPFAPGAARAPRCRRQPERGHRTRPSLAVGPVRELGTFRPVGGRIQRSADRRLPSADGCQDRPRIGDRMLRIRVRSHDLDPHAGGRGLPLHDGLPVAEVIPRERPHVHVTSHRASSIEFDCTHPYARECWPTVTACLVRPVFPAQRHEDETAGSPSAALGRPPLRTARARRTDTASEVRHGVADGLP
jgi:hypothetical protein